MDQPKSSMGIPIRFTGPNGEELSLGEYMAVRKDVYEAAEAILSIASSAFQLSGEVRVGKQSPDEFNRLMNRLHAAYQRWEAAVRAPAHIRGGADSGQDTEGKSS